MRGVLEPLAHLLGDAHEQVVEDLEQHRIGVGAERLALRPGLDPREHQVIARRHLGSPAGLDDRRLVLLGEDRRPAHHVAGARVVARVERRVVPASAREQPHRLRRAQRRRARGEIARRLDHRGAAGDRLDRDRLDDQRSTLHQEREALPVRVLERGAHRLGRVLEHHERGVGARVAQVNAAEHVDARSLDPLRDQVGARLVREGVERRARDRDRGRFERDFDGFLAHRGLIREAHSIGREHAGERVREHPRHAERVGHEARVLAAGAAEDAERVLGDVVSARDRDLLDGACHALRRDGDEAFGDLLGRAELARERGDFLGK